MLNLRVKLKRFVGIAAAASIALSCSSGFAAEIISAEYDTKVNTSENNNAEVLVAQDKTDEGVYWSIEGAEGESAEGKYLYSDDYADILFQINTEAGDTIDENGISFIGTGFSDSGSQYSKINQNNRYILFMPKYSGTLDISAVFANPNGSVCRIYAIPLNASSVDTVNLVSLGELVKDGNMIKAAETTSKTDLTAVSQNIEIEADKVYALVPYSYFNSPSIIEKFGYRSEFEEKDYDAEYTLSEVRAEHGRVVFDKKEAKYNEDVTAEVVTDIGYTLGTLDINGTTVLAANTQGINTVSFKMPAKAINEENVSLKLDSEQGLLDVNAIHDFDGEISGTSSKKSEILFDGTVNTNTVDNSAVLTYENDDDLILDAGEGNRFLLSEIIAYSKIGANEKATFRVHGSDSLDDLSNSTGTGSTVILKSTPGQYGSNTVQREVLNADEYAKTVGYRYLRIKYFNVENALSEIKIYAEIRENPPVLNLDGDYSDGIQLYMGRKNRLSGTCYKMGETTFKLLNENNEEVWSETQDLTGKTEWSALVNEVNDTEGAYNFTVESNGKIYAEIKNITFADLPVLKFDKEEYDGEAIKIPVNVLAVDVNEKIDFYAAEYSESGKLIGLNAVEKNITESGTIEIAYKRNSPLSVIKLYAWKGMKPYIEPRYIYEDVDTSLSVAPGSVTYDSAVIVWDRPAGENDAIYDIYSGDEKIGSSDKLYYAAENLKSETVYSFEVKKGSESLGTVTFKTGIKGENIDIEKYGADTSNTAEENRTAIQAAIDDCPKNGTVKIPAGKYVTGALFLHSDMTLYLEDGAILKGSGDVKDYLVNGEMIDSRFEGWELKSYASLINAGKLDNKGGYNCRNISICGKGTISGGGQALGTAMTNASGERSRGRLISFNNCQNVNLSGIRIENPPCWTVHMIYSDRISTYNTTIDSKSGTRVRNGDGWDPDSSTNLMLFGTVFNTGDDCIAIKSGKNPEGNKINKPAKNIRIFNCESSGGLGLAIGSEMSGGIENIYISNCNIKNTRYGLEMKATKKRGGYIRNIYVKDSSFDQILMHSVSYNDDGQGADEMPYFSNMSFENINVPGYSYYNGVESVETPIQLKGFDNKDNYIKNVLFKNIIVGDELNVMKKVSLQYCSDVSFENMKQFDGNGPEYIISDCEEIRY